MRVVMINLGLTAVLLIGIELVAAAVFYFDKGYLVYWQPRTDAVFVNAHLSRHLRPSFTMQLSSYPNYPGDLVVNDDGLVDTLNFHKASPLVLVIGGSTVEGRGSSNNNVTIPSWLAQCLHDNKFEAKVINGGRSGLHSYTEYRLLAEYFLPEFAPDIVVSVNGRNDLHYGLRNPPRSFSFHSDVRNYEELYRYDRYGPSISDAAFSFFRRTHLWRSIEWFSKKISRNVLDNKVYENLLIVSPAEREVRSKQMADAFVAQIEMTRILVQSRGALYFHFFQPSLLNLIKDIHPAEVVAIDEWYARSRLGEDYGTELRAYTREVQSRLKEKSIDLTNLFLGMSDQIYVDSVHYNDLGNQIIAGEICNEIIAYKKFE